MTDYFVSVDGNNKNSGTSSSSPWKYIQKGIDALSAGDTLYIMEGTYDPGMERRDNWTIRNKNGTADRPIAIRNYRSDAVKLTGRESGAGNGFPQSGVSVHPRSVTYKGTTYELTTAGLVEVDDCSYLTIDGLQVCDSLGEGIKMQGSRRNTYEDGANGADLHHVVVQNCRVHNTRQRNMRVQNGWQVTIQNCELSFGSWALQGGSGGPSIFNGYYIYFDNNVVHQVAGESFIADGNNYPSRNIYVRNNVFFDCESPILFHGVSYAICVGNFFYNTPQELEAPKGFTASSSKAVTVKPSECNKPVQKPTEYVLVAHNIVANRPLGIVAKTEPDDPNKCPKGWESQPLRHVYVVYNTVINCQDSNFRIATDTASDCVFKGNLSFNSAGKHVSDGQRESVGWDTDYNLYSSPTSISANLRGKNDIEDVDPQLYGTTAPSKGQTSEQNAGYYANFDLRNGYDDATNFRIKPGSPCIDAAPTVKAPSEWAEMNDYLDWSYNFTNSGINPKRTGSWDIGAHELAVEETITADFSARPTSGESPLTVSFKDTSDSTSPITSRFWDFGDGVISTERNPTHEYGQGQFTVSLRVTSSAGTDIATKSNLINVTAPAEPLPERVTEGLNVLYRFNEGSGDTVYDVSGEGAPLDLRISDTTAVNWLPQGIDIAQSTVLVSNGPATKINNAIRESNELTLEVWLMPRQRYQDGPARILSISKNMHSRNITLGHGLWGTQPSDLYDVRLRTTERSANGMPSFSTPAGLTEKRKMHLVFLRKSGGRARYIIDGTVVAETDIPGDFSTWNPRFPLLLGNETTGDYPWRGEIYLVAIYNRALSLDEVRQNFAAGTEQVPRLLQTPAALTTSFRRFVLVRNGNGSTFTNGTQKAVAYGVEYPDKRCVLCANGQTSSMAIYRDINAIVRAYSKQGLAVSWLD